MKLVSFTHAGSTRAGVLTESGDIADMGSPITDLLADGALMDRAKKALAGGTTIPATEAAIEAPVPRPPKVLAIGLNYRDHAEESGQPIPQRPVVFAKMPTCIVGPDHPIYVPRVSRAVDWEAELCFVIAKKARYVSAADAQLYIAGYCIGNDVSVRDWQFHSPTWMMGKSFDTHGPIGPWLVTPDEVNVGNLGVRLYVNDDLKQDSNTNQLIFGVGDIIEYLSAGFTLEPGDTVRVEIAGLGVLSNPVAEEPA